MSGRQVTVSRRDALLIAAAAVAAACKGASAPPAMQRPRPPTLKLNPLVDLVPAAGLSWLVQARLHEITSSPLLAPAIDLVVPEERFAGFALRHGGVDLRQVSELVVAGFPETTLSLARVPVSEGLISSWFAARAAPVEGRAVEGEVTRYWGSVGASREQVAVLGGEGVAVEHGHLGPLRAALYFAEGKLKRALPALQTDPLARAAALLDADGPAPVRAFRPGPFEGEWAAGLGGLLRVTTAMAGAARPRLWQPSRASAEQGKVGDAGADGSGALWVTLVLVGSWGEQAQAAAERLAAAARVLADDPLGRLLGLDHPLEGPRVSGNPDSVRLDVTLDALALGRGVRAATGATMAEILAY
jgi:hypothetical protein